ncbi:BsaA family SipW-dependent biofilm matrix protein [Enterococcus crotali]|uniref:BsaA family SipW-dependent biofilm matrix protein n=1 Tax=Enterococcus crotali TaxID=1453587 RepID=UPI00046F22B8|nr:BsaA family SipW-dependent biofilm matrix protein [Enterococcus crotali]
MKKKKRRSVKYKKKARVAKRGFRLYLALFALLFSSLLILGSTYAWFTSADSVTNKFESGRFQAELTEVFKPNLAWQPGKDTTKQIRVQNTGQSPALVRVSLYEYLLTFKIDVRDKIGNGNLITVSSEQKPVVNWKDLSTWQPASERGGTYKDGSLHYVANKAYIADQKNGKDRYKLNDPARKALPFHFIEINFSAYLNTSLPKPEVKNYWLYEDGYFYYSEVLPPGNISEPLVDNVSLSSSASNTYKGALYQLNPYLEAHDPVKTVIKEWGIGTNSLVYGLFKDKLN